MTALIFIETFSLWKMMNFNKANNAIFIENIPLDKKQKPKG